MVILGREKMENSLDQFWRGLALTLSNKFTKSSKSLYEKEIDFVDKS